MKNNNILTITAFLAVFTAILVSGCSVVFTGSITGSLADKSAYENGDAGYEIADAEVYLYTEEETRDADYNAWASNNNTLPDNPSGGEPQYFLKTISDDQGSYTFNGFIWNELFPDYGKSGDRKEIFMLFYHKEYGLVKTPYPIYVVSDVTNRIPLFKLDKILNVAEISGTVSDAETEVALANVNIRIWIPESWAYDSDGNITGPEWPDSPSYTAVSDDIGEWSREISYKMMPSSTDNRGTTIVRITYAANGYLAENAADSEIIDGGWDRDGNGTVDADEDEGYFESSPISADSYTELGDIALANEYNTATISGKVTNSGTRSGEENVSVRIYVAEDWSYNSSDPEDIEAADDVTWPENPQYTITTDADGEYSTGIQFERKPSETDNRGTVRVRLVFVKDSFLISQDTDSKLTDGGWDRDGNGTVDADEDDAFYDPSDVVTADIDNALGSITIKQTEFNETLTGEVWDSTHATLVNGVEVWLFFDPVDDDVDPLTPMETSQPHADDVPDFTDTTDSVILTTDSVEKGYFSFSGLEWQDEGYPDNQSKVSFYIHLPDATERANGDLSGDLSTTNDKHYLYSGSTNSVNLTSTEY